MSGSRVRSDGTKWGERVIRDGSIRWWGRTYHVAPEKPAEGTPDFVPRAYDGSLDGLTATFYEYGHTEHFPTLRDRVYLHSFGDKWPGPNCDGRYWHFEEWIAEDAAGPTTINGEKP